jgi:putative sigma-54 modulation protein
MRIDVLTRSQQPGIDVREAARRSIRYALDRLAPMIAAVKLKIRDLNGPRGGVDQSAQVTLKLVDGSTLVAHSTAELQTEAIDRALTRVKRTLSARLERGRQRRRPRAPREMSLAAL